MSVYVFTGGVDSTWTNAGNWAPSGPPGAGDVAIFDGRMGRALTGNPAASPQLLAIKQYMNAAFAVGTLAAPIAVCADNVEIGLEATDGSSAGGNEFHINTGTNIGSKFVVYGTKSTGSSGQDPVTIKTGTPASGNHSVFVHAGTVGLATAAAADAATILTFNATGGRTNFGAGMVTGWNATISGTAKVFTQTATSGTVTLNGGEWTSEGVGLIAAANLYGGTYFCNHRLATAIITTLTLGGNAPTTPTLDLRADAGAVIFTDATLSKGRILVATSGQVTYTNAPTLSFGNSTAMTISLS